MRELNAKPFKKAQVDSTGERNTLRKLSAGRDDTKWFAEFVERTRSAPVAERGMGDLAPVYIQR